jgi:hypothetical protein
LVTPRQILALLQLSDHKLLISYLSSTPKFQQTRPECAKQLGFFIFAFADSKKNGLMMRDGEIVNLNRKKNQRRRSGRRSSRKQISTTSSQHSHLNEPPPPDPEK